MTQKYQTIILNSMYFQINNPAETIQQLIDRGHISKPEKEDLLIIEEDIVAQYGSGYKNKFEHFFSENYAKTFTRDLQTLINKITNPQAKEALEDINSTITSFIRNTHLCDLSELTNSYKNLNHNKLYFSNTLKY